MVAWIRMVILEMVVFEYSVYVEGKLKRSCISVPGNKGKKGVKNDFLGILA